MGLIHHITAGTGGTPIVFVHGFSCDHTDWNAQVTHFSPRHRVVSVDLPGHGKSKAPGTDCSIEAFGVAVASLMRRHDLPPAIIVGHSMGCRVAPEIAVQVPDRTLGVVLIDGSQFSAATEALMRGVIGEGKLDTALQGMFSAMFNEKSAPAVKSAIIERAMALPKDVAAQMTLDSVRYDLARLEPTLAAVKCPMLCIQTTVTNERRERVPVKKGEAVPYFDMLRRVVPGVEIEVIEGCGHFPQIDAPAETNALLERFIAKAAKR